MTGLRLNTGLDVDRLTHSFQEHRRVRIYDLLEREDAEALHAHLEDQNDWWRLINVPDGIMEYDRRAWERLGVRRRRALDEQVFAQARDGFQYRYEGLRVPDEPDRLEEDDDPLTAFARLMDSDDMLDMLRQITGQRDISFSDGHATAYSPGDFLTEHDDDVPGKGRLAAYVYGLTRAWRPEWGGILMFHKDDGATIDGHVPRFNTLDLFAVPQQHSVSMVTPSAPVRRYAVTGWLRASLPDGYSNAE